MKVKVFDTKGKNIEEVTLSKKIWEVPMNEDVVSQALLVYLFNQRKGTAHTKTRAEVRGGGKKPWRQKGTGRARHGSIRSPLWTKGGVTFGPRSYKNIKKLSKKMSALAMRCVLSQFAKDSQLVVVDGLEASKLDKTKAVVKMMNDLKLDNDKVLFITKSDEKDYELLSRGVSNLQKVTLKRSDKFNIYDAVNADKLMIIKDAVKDLEKRLS